MGADLIAIEEASENGRIDVKGKLSRPYQVAISVVHAGDERTPIQYFLSSYRVGAKGTQRILGDRAVHRLNLVVVDPGPCDQDGELNMPKALKPLDVSRIYPPSRDDQNRICQIATVELFQSQE